MTTTYTIYHNPRCSKSRQTLALLEEHNITPSIVEYLNSPPDAETLRNILRLLDLEPRALMRQKEAQYSEANLGNAELSDAQLIAAMIATPILIERPIVIKRTHDQTAQAVIGRPPENVLALIE